MQKKMQKYIGILRTDQRCQWWCGALAFGASRLGEIEARWAGCLERAGGRERGETKRDKGRKGGQKKLLTRNV